MQMFTLSIITCVLILGLFFINLKTISFLKVALSKAYKTMLESTKITAFVRFFAVKFKVTHIYTVVSPKVESFFSFRLIPFLFFDRKCNNLYLFSNKFFRKFDGLLRISVYDNFSVHNVKPNTKLDF